MEGVSDLRRFWGGRSCDFSGDEIVAFMRTLPEESATERARSGMDVTLQTYLIGLGIDVARAVSYAQSGKRIPTEQLIAPELSGENRRQRERIAQLRERVRASMVTQPAPTR